MPGNTPGEFMLPLPMAARCQGDLLRKMTIKHLASCGPDGQLLARKMMEPLQSQAPSLFEFGKPRHCPTSRIENSSVHLSEDESGRRFWEGIRADLKSKFPVVRGEAAKHCWMMGINPKKLVGED